MINLRALSSNRPATEMILLARGQLNCAFRSKGLFPPDPLSAEMIADVGLIDLDDPAGRGIGHALEIYPDAFKNWSAGLSRDLVSPALAILSETMSRIKGNFSEGRTKRQPLEQACDYLLSQMSRSSESVTG